MSWIIIKHLNALITEFYMKDFLAQYSIYRANTLTGFRERDTLLEIRREEYLKEWCKRSESYHRFQASDNESAILLALIQRESLHFVPGFVAEVTLDELFEINSVSLEGVEQKICNSHVDYVKSQFI